MQHRRSGAGARRLHSKRIVQCAVDPIVFLSLSGEDSAIYHQNAANQGVRAQRLSLDVLSLAEASVGRAWLSLRASASVCLVAPRSQLVLRATRWTNHKGVRSHVARGVRGALHSRCSQWPVWRRPWPLPLLAPTRPERHEPRPTSTCTARRAADYHPLSGKGGRFTTLSLHPLSLLELYSFFSARKPTTHA